MTQDVNQVRTIALEYTGYVGPAPTFDVASLPKELRTRVEQAITIAIQALKNNQQIQEGTDLTCLTFSIDEKDELKVKKLNKEGEYLDLSGYVDEEPKKTKGQPSIKSVIRGFWLLRNIEVAKTSGEADASTDPLVTNARAGIQEKVVHKKEDAPPLTLWQRTKQKVRWVFGSHFIAYDTLGVARNACQIPQGDVGVKYFNFQASWLRLAQGFVNLPNQIKQWFQLRREFDGLNKVPQVKRSRVKSLALWNISVKSSYIITNLFWITLGLACLLALLTPWGWTAAASVILADLLFDVVFNVGAIVEFIDDIRERRRIKKAIKEIKMAIAMQQTPEAQRQVLVNMVKRTLQLDQRQITKITTRIEEDGSFVTTEAKNAALAAAKKHEDKDTQKAQKLVTKEEALQAAIERKINKKVSVLQSILGEDFVSAIVSGDEKTKDPQFVKQALDRMNTQLRRNMEKMPAPLLCLLGMMFIFLPLTAPFFVAGAIFWVIVNAYYLFVVDTACGDKFGMWVKRAITHEKKKAVVPPIA